MFNLAYLDPLDHARSLRIGIAAVVAAVIVSMWAGVGISIHVAEEAAEKEMELTAANLAFAFDQEVTHTLDVIAGTMDAVASRMRAQEADTNIYAWSRQFPIVGGPIVNVGVIAPNGMLVAETRAAETKPVDLREEEYFRVHLDGKFRGLFIGKPVKSRGYNELLIPITKRVDGASGRFLGVLVFFVSPAKLTSLYKSIDLGEKGSITLVGSHGVILARFSKRSTDGLETIGGAVGEKISPELVAKNDQGSDIAVSQRDHVKRLLSYRRSADYPLVVSVGLDYDAGLALARAHAHMVSALAGVATLLLAGLAFYLTLEIRSRAKRDIELAAEREKLRAANDGLQSANAELSEAKQTAESASQAKSLFLANMSHELRTPLNAIIGFSQIIKEQSLGPGKPVYADYAKDIFVAGEHLLEIINNILDISKIEAGKTEIRDEPIEVSELVTASFVAVRVQAEVKNIALVSDVPRDLPGIRGDALRLRQILINLVSNAVKFTEAGQVTVTAACDPATGLTVTIADTGIGMSPEEIAIAVEPFVQVENAITKKYEGTGLGLSIARRLVELHGGSLTIESNKGVGTTITFQLPPERLILPLAEAPAKKDAPRPKRRRSA